MTLSKYHSRLGRARRTARASFSARWICQFIGKSRDSGSRPPMHQRAFGADDVHGPFADGVVGVTLGDGCDDGKGPSAGGSLSEIPRSADADPGDGTGSVP